MADTDRTGMADDYESDDSAGYDSEVDDVSE